MWHLMIISPPFCADAARYLRFMTYTNDVTNIFHCTRHHHQHFPVFILSTHTLLLFGRIPGATATGDDMDRSYKILQCWGTTSLGRLLLFEFFLCGQMDVLVRDYIEREREREWLDRRQLIRG
jgi:hypothetical protein